MISAKKDSASSLHIFSYRQFLVLAQNSQPVIKNLIPLWVAYICITLFKLFSVNVAIILQCGHSCAFGGFSVELDLDLGSREVPIYSGSSRD